MKTVRVLVLAYESGDRDVMARRVLGRKEYECQRKRREDLGTVRGLAEKLVEHKPHLVIMEWPRFGIAAMDAIFKVLPKCYVIIASPDLPKFLFVGAQGLRPEIPDPMICMNKTHWEKIKPSGGGILDNQRNVTDLPPKRRTKTIQMLAVAS